ncbi:MAG: hypothetical protein ABIQ64_02100 [Candidatus Saccharimonadales bacterium]
MIDKSVIPEICNKTRKMTAILAMSGAALTGCSSDSLGVEVPEKQPTTTITVPESGTVDSMSEVLDIWCEGKLDHDEREDAVKLTQFASNKSSTGVQPLEVLTTYVGICDIVQNE